jgi:hypothetical protein
MRPALRIGVFVIVYQLGVICHKKPHQMILGAEGIMYIQKKALGFKLIPLEQLNSCFWQELNTHHIMQVQTMVARSKVETWIQTIDHHSVHSPRLIQV